MEYTLKELAALTNGRVEGDENIKVNTFAKIEDATPGSITFLANPKYTHFIYNTEASAVIVSESFVAEKPVKSALLRVADPYQTLASLMALAQKAAAHATPCGVETPCHIAEDTAIPENAYIGAFSYLGKGVRIGEGVKIYPQCYIGDGVEIGEGTVIRPGVKIYEGCRIGKRCILHSGVVIGADGFGFAPTPDGKYEKIPQIGNVVLGDDVEVGANTTIDRATLGCTRVGDGTKLDNLIQVAHNVTLGRSNVIAAQTGIAGSAHIGDYNMIGGQTGIAGHISIGSFNEIGAQSGIPNTVGDGKRLIGYPAVDARQFAKTQVYLKRLGELFNSKK